MTADVVMVELGWQAVLCQSCGERHGWTQPSNKDDKTDPVTWIYCDNCIPKSETGVVSS